ncbi:unknown protein [Simkania negevensis Z]|uniref:Uncharacterized protein n=1 Tax=Simkania negevensis (strain ATCC VR-1471 / DSM 27360 / Z) TaxID=331113 RepID=F8L4E6_SIMNZ|nr:unknown protein [Simkania negevensis Z]
MLELAAAHDEDASVDFTAIVIYPSFFLSLST